MTTLTLGAQALIYAKYGLEIFALHPDKTPATRNGMNDATTDLEQVATWWERMPDALIGCRIPVGMVILDVDPRHGGDKTLEALAVEFNHGLPIEATRWHLSGRGDGGGHHWFEDPGFKLSVKGLDAWAEEHGVGHPAGEAGQRWTSGIDLLHHGHRYTVLPLSPHPDTWEPYVWGQRAGVETGLDVEPGPMPMWLQDLLRPPPNTVPVAAPFKSNGSTNAFTGAGSGTTTEDSIADWFSNTATWGQILTGWYLVGGNGDDDGSKWRHPNASAPNSATIRHGQLFVYSSNTDFTPTESGDPHGYTRFRAWSILEFGGDMAEAGRRARELRDGPQEDWRDWIGWKPKGPQPGDRTPPQSDAPEASRLVDGWSFISATPNHEHALWGRDDEVLWPEGEPLLVVSAPGVGKTTLAIQLVAGRLGLVPDVLGYPCTPTSDRVLYLAMDRPNQIARAMGRYFGPEHADVLGRQLVVWRGPLPADLGKHPDTLLEVVKKANCGTVFIDSLKDAAVKLSDDEVGGNLNRAIQTCIAEGIEVCGSHHQRKQPSGDSKKPTNLDEVYGSTWITSGAGSVVMLWGAAGDPIVELLHLKQPASVVGPMMIETDPFTGRTVVYRGFDPLVFLRNRGAVGATAIECARAKFEKEKPTDNEANKARRLLDGLVHRNLARRADPLRGGSGGTQAARYFLVDEVVLVAS